MLNVGRIVCLSCILVIGGSTAARADATTEEVFSAWRKRQGEVKSLKATWTVQEHHAAGSSLGRNRAMANGKPFPPEAVNTNA